MALDALVSTGWLAENLGQHGLTVIDLRAPADGGRASFEAGHIPGAIFSDYAADGWRKRVGNVPGLLPEAAHLSTLFAQLGVTPESHVVLIPTGSGANDLAASARAFWTLKIAGHQAVSILDGGTKRWQAEGRALETGPDAPRAAALYPVSFQPGWRMLAADVLETLGQRTLIDARSASYYAGSEKAAEAKRAGHIPGAHSLDYARLFDPATGALKSRAELEALFAPIPTGPTTVYCNTGHTAALDWFALRMILNRPETLLYDGSMTEWTQDEARPVEV